MVNLPIGQIDTITIQALDVDGNPVPFTPDAPPVWSNGAPAIIQSTPSGDGLTDVVTPLVAGSASIGVSASVGGAPFSASDTENVVASTGTQSPLTLHAVFTMADGMVHNVAATGGLDAGDYIGEFVHQKCIRCTVPGTDFTIFFRRDADGTRPEIVVERGQVINQTITPAQIQTTYQVQFYDGATLLATINPTAHWYFARWRWPNTPRPVVRNVATLLSRKWIPPLTTSSGLNCTAFTTTVKPYVNPMDVCDIFWDGSTGERPEIGLVTEWQADYILNGTSASFAQMMAHAEVNASIAIHIRDETTGAPLNIQVHKYMSLNSSSGSGGFINPGPKPIDPLTGKVDKRYRLTDAAHHPDLCGVPWMLTDDPYYLEELQFTSLYCSLQSSYFPHQLKLPGIGSIEQTRGWAWSKRDAFRAQKFTPASPPSWLLPQSVFTQNLSDMLTYANLIMASPAKVYKVYHTISKCGGLEIWQKGYDSYTIAHAVKDLGFTDWTTHYNWHIQCILNQYNGTSGWNASDPMPYETKLFTNGFDSGYLADTSQDANTVPSYAALWAAFKAANAINDSGWDPTLMYTDQQGPEYTIILYASLKSAADIGVSGGSALVTKLKNAWTQVKKWDGTAGYDATKGKGNMKWSV